MSILYFKKRYTNLNSMSKWSKFNMDVSAAFTMAAIKDGRINIEEPRYDQETFTGRAKHFFITTNPFNVLATNSQLDHAKSVVEKYR